MKKKTKKIQLKPEKDYISDRAGVVRSEIQDNIEKMKILDQTDYSRFILNIIKSQDQYVDRKIINEEDYRLLRSLNERFEKLSVIYNLHKDRTHSFFSDLVSEYEDTIKENILDGDIEPEKRIRNVIEWFEDNLKCGFSEKKVKEKLTTECLKGIYDDYNTVENVKEILITSPDSI